jgi:hypothetical protein
MRNDQSIQDAARALFEGLVPERRAELEQLWADHAPRFNLLEDFSQHGSFVLDAGGYRDVRFNYRVMRAFWVASFAAWEGYRAIAEGVTAGSLNLSFFKAIIACVQKIISENDPESVTLPGGIPEPGILPDAAKYPQLRAAAELAHFATGWALLHEVQHIIHQRKGTSAGANGTRAENHAEELSCDAFATAFLLDRVLDYAKDHQENASLVAQKRQIGVYFALFAMTVFAKGHWAASDTHPALQDRIDATIRMISSRSLTAEVIAHLAFIALSALWPETPRVLSPAFSRS